MVPCIAKGGCCYTSGRCRVIAAIVTVVLLIGMGLGIWFGAPRIGDEEVAATTLKFIQVNISDPDSNSFQMDSRLELSGLEPVSARMHAFTATLLFGGKPFATTRMPPMEVQANTVNIRDTSGRAQVTDKAIFTSFNKAVLADEQVSLGVKGTVDITTRTKALSNVVIRGLHLNKVVQLKGSAGLRGARVTAISMADSTPDQLRVALAVEVNNPGTMSIAGLGTMCLDVIYRGEKMGRVAAQNVSLPRGKSTLLVEGQLLPGNRTDTEALISRFLDGYSTQVVNQGVMCAGASPLFGPAASSLRLEVQFPGNPIPMVDGLIVDGLSMIPRKDGTVAMQLNATVTVNSPLGANAPIELDNIAMDADLVGAGFDVGHLHVPKTNVSRKTFESRYSATADGSLPSGTNGQGTHGAALIHAHAMLPGAHAPARGRSTPSGPVPPIVKQNITLALASILDLSGGGIAMGEFVSEFIRKDNVAVTLEGKDDQAMKVTLRSALGPLELHVPVLARSRLPGMRNFPEVLVSGFNLDGPTADGKGLLARNLVTLLNPSPVEVRMGDRVQFGIYSAESGNRLGSMIAFDADLPPGRTVLNMSGVIQPQEGGLPDMSHLFSNYLTGKATRVSVKGENVTFGGGVDTPGWLLKAVRNISMDTVLPGAENLTITTDLELSVLNMSFVPPPGAPADPDPATYVPMSSGVVHGTVHVPFSNVPMDILSTNVTFEYDDLKTGRPMAKVVGTNQRCKYSPFPVPGPGTAAGVIDIFLTPAYLEVLDAELLSQFIADILLTPTATMRIRSNVSQLIRVPVGDLIISGIQLEQVVDVPGLDAFRNPPIDVIRQDIVGSTETTIIAAAEFNISNPSIVDGLFTRAVVDMVYMGEVVATSVLPAFDLKKGGNIVSSETVLLPPPDDKAHEAQHKAFRSFVSNYLVGNSTPVTLTGHADSTPVPLLKKAFSNFRSNVVVPGTTSPLVINATLDILKWQDGDVLGRVLMNNPTGVDITLIDSNLYVYGCAQELANTTCLEFDYSSPSGLFSPESFENAPVVIPAHSIVLTPEKPFLLMGDKTERFIGQLLADGAANTAIGGNFTMLQGLVMINIEYQQKNILTYVAL